ncbi:MAG: YgaP family membrane protein [Burkholderiales bacterium]
MTVDNFVHVFAGIFILLSLALGVQASPLFHSSYWLWFTTFVGANLLQSGFTGFCPLAIFLKKLGVKESYSAGARA